MALLDDGPCESLVRLETGDWLLLRTSLAGDPTDEAILLERAASLAKAKGPPLSLVAVGTASVPPSPLFSRLGVFAVSPDGVVRGPRLTGQRARVIRRILEHSLQRVAGEPARELTPDQRGALLERGAVLREGEVHGEEARFWSRLQQQTPWGLYALTAAIVVVFLLESFWGGSAFSPTLYRMGADVPGTLRSEPYRLFAAAFLHIGIVHLLVNLWALWVFGDFLERVLGTTVFLVLYALSALVGSLVSLAFGTAGLSAGASGALWGLMVGGFVLSYWGGLPPALKARIRARGWQPILVNLAISFAPGIALSAHAGGGIAGGALVLAWNLVPEERDAGVRRVLTPLAVLLCVLMAVSVVWAVVAGRPWELRGPVELVRTPIPGTSMTIDVPRALSPIHSQAASEWTLGALPKDPAVVVIHITSAEPPFDIPGMRTEEGKPALPSAKDLSPIESVILDKGKRLARRSYSFGNGGVGTITVAQNATARIRVELLAIPGAPSSWVAVGDRIAASLRTP